MNRVEDLRALLAALQPADAIESGHVERMRALLCAGEQAFSREHYLPGHFTASGFVATPDRSAMLLIFHSKLARWLQPGGHVEPNDVDVIAAARREVQEEVGLGGLPLAVQGIFNVDVHVIPARGDAPAHEHFDVQFLFECDSKAVVAAASDAAAVRWAPVEEINSRDADESVMRAVRKLKLR